MPLSRDNLVINELLREYLLFNGYRNTLSVLLPGTFKLQILLELSAATFVCQAILLRRSCQCVLQTFLK